MKPTCEKQLTTRLSNLMKNHGFDLLKAHTTKDEDDMILEFFDWCRAEIRLGADGRSSPRWKTLDNFGMKTYASLQETANGIYSSRSKVEGYETVLGCVVRVEVADRLRQEARRFRK